MHAPPAPTFENLADLVRASGEVNKVALIETAEGKPVRQTTFAELDALSGTVASRLVLQGLRRGDAVAILAANGIDYVAAYLGIMRAGMVAVPMNFRLSPDMVRRVLEDAGTRFAFTDAERLDLCPPDLPRALIPLADEGGGAAFESIRPEPGETAMLLYTSGSTGMPKGVPIAHDGQIWALEGRARGADLRGHRFLIAAPLFHMNGLFSLKLALMSGASVVLLPRFNTRHYIEAIEACRCTWLTSVPTMLAMVVREKEALAATDLSSVKIASMASGPVTEALVADVQAAFPAARVTVNYGTTETGAAVFGNHPEGRPRPAISLGYPLADIGFRMVDAGGAEVADEGIVHLKTRALMSGYHNRPDLTAKVILGDGWYNTGDIMRRDADGFVYFVGRADDMFVCGGENIYPSEVERMLERHADIVQACVVPVPDDLKSQKPVAFVVARPGAVLVEDEIKAFALANGPAYAHPRQVHVVAELPLASTNKVDRSGLAKRARELAQ